MVSEFVCKHIIPCVLEVDEGQYSPSSAVATTTAATSTKRIIPSSSSVSDTLSVVVDITDTPLAIFPRKSYYWSIRVA